MPRPRPVLLLGEGDTRNGLFGESRMGFLARGVTGGVEASDPGVVSIVGNGTAVAVVVVVEMVAVVFLFEGGGETGAIPVDPVIVPRR